MSAPTAQPIGNIDERGYLNGMRRRGYTPQKCLLEICANACDASQGQDVGPSDQKKFLSLITRERIRLIDNSAGMTVEGLENMFSLHRSNHSEHKSMGVSGIGAKPALLILSETTTVKVSTRTRDGEYIIATVPWKEIMDAGRYTGMVTRREMTAEERDAFRDERAKYSMHIRGQPVGTTIEFAHNDLLENLLLQQASHMNPLDQTGVVFGHVTDYAFEVVGSDGKHLVLPKYNYFGGHRPDYYGEVRRDQIEQYYSAASNDDRFIWKRADGDYEIVRDGRGFSKDVKKVVKNLQGYRLVGSFEALTGCRVDPNIFDLAKPADVLGCTGTYTHIYDAPFFSEELDYASKSGTALIRNLQYIGNIPLIDYKPSSARGDSKSAFDNMLVHQELEYYPPSQQDNHQDITMNIQENKNQFDGAAVPIPLRRLLRAIRLETAAQLRAYFDERRKEYKAQMAAAAEEPPVPVVQEEPAVPEEQPVSEEEESVLDSGDESDSNEEAAPAPVPPPPALPESPELGASEDDAPPPPIPVTPRSISGHDLLNLLERIMLDIEPERQYERGWLSAQIANGMSAFAL